VRKQKIAALNIPMQDPQPEQLSNPLRKLPQKANNLLLSQFAPLDQLRETALGTILGDQIMIVLCGIHIIAAQNVGMRGQAETPDLGLEQVAAEGG
jgi:hypothetical protein